MVTPYPQRPDGMRHSSTRLFSLRMCSRQDGPVFLHYTFSTYVFDTNLRHTPLIWAIEVCTLSVLFTSSALTTPDRYMDVFAKSAYAHGNLLDPRSKSS